MLFVLIALWTAALIIWLSDTKSTLHHRLGAIAFAGGAGALAAVIDLEWAPAAERAGISAGGELLLYQLQAVSSVFSYYAVPYFYLWFALAYNPVIKQRRLLRYVPFVLLLPIAACLLLTPGYTEQFPITYSAVIWWAVPYVAAGTLLLLLKRHAWMDRTHALLCLALIPTVLFSAVMNYVLPYLGYYRMWVYNTWAVALAIVIFGVSLFTYGFLGMRIMFQRRRYDYTLKAVTSGTAILNHAIKNDAGKLLLFSEKMKSYAISTGQNELLADVETVLAAAQHMEQMVQRVHKRTENVQLKLERTDLAELIERTLKSYEPSFRGVQCSVSCARGWTVQIDAVQVGEALGNLIANALEAMKGTGRLAISLIEHKRKLIIEVSDTGPGLSRGQASQVFEPFYTTKQSAGSNFGLGLSYCYAVMRKHRGELQLRTAPGEGAAFSMIFGKRAAAAELAVAVQAERSEAVGQ